MIVQIKRIILLLGIVCLPTEIFSQHSSKNNYTGAWETPTSWNPTWSSPQTNNLSSDITINGYITVNGSLSFSILPCNLIINDTLVINGSLTLGLLTNLTVNGNGILIVRGNLNIGIFSDIITNNYIVVTGDVRKFGSVNTGSFISNNNPEKVFIDGDISPSSLHINKPNFNALNCSAPTTTPYPNSTCSYGNMADIINDPIYPFFQSICTISNPTIKAGGPTTFCAGGSVTLTSSSGTSYLWSGGETTQNIDISTAGSYTVKVTDASGCLSTSSSPAAIIVNPLPVVSVGNNGPVCAGSPLNLTGGPAGMKVYYWTGPGEFSSLMQNPLVTDSATFDMAGTYTLIVANNNGCTNTAKQNIVINTAPVAVAGPDQELKFTFETQMNALLSSSETGEWSMISGSGKINDIHSPSTMVAELSTGINKFLWKVMNGNCEDTAEVKITVHDVFVPSVITPNGDGKNDYFKISEFTGNVQLVIFNRWGNEEYKSDNYLNDWDGRNNKGAELPNDTYFYILKFENDRVLKGSIFIKR